MRFYLPYAAVGLALAIGAPAAHAQTIITTQPAPAVIAQPRLVTVPAAPVVQPAETIQTIQTVAASAPANRDHPHHYTARAAGGACSGRWNRGRGSAASI